jgi:hypothetical protein
VIIVTNLILIRVRSNGIMFGKLSSIERSGNCVLFRPPPPQGILMEIRSCVFKFISSFQGSLTENKYIIFGYYCCCHHETENSSLQGIYHKAKKKKSRSRKCG